MDFAIVATTLGALAQQTRVRLLHLLASAGPGGLAAGRLATELAVPASTLSFHLSALMQAGLVRSVRRGRQTIYATRQDGLRRLLGFAAHACCGHRPELDAALGRLLPDAEAPGMTAAFDVLFLCTRNSARSIMAEAILQQVGRGRFRAYSAGSDPAAAPLPAVIDKLRTLGHDVERLRCKSWDAFARPDAPRMDFVIALCDAPHGQQCPDFGKATVTAAWPMPDPAQFIGSPVEHRALLNELYRGIHRRIELFCSLPFDKLDHLAAKRRLDQIAGGELLAA